MNLITVCKDLREFVNNIPVNLFLLPKNRFLGVVKTYITNILQYLELTVSKYPEKTAFSDGLEDLSFRQLYDRARAVGSFLSLRGYYKEPIIVFADKKPNTIAMLMGIIYAGCFYVCLDSEMPQSRLELILASLEPRAIVYDKKSENAAANLSTDIQKYLFDDICDSDVDKGILSSVRERQIDTDQIYITFTSGSTGTPKGVSASHRSVIDYTETLCEALGFDESTIFANQTPLFYDAPLKEIMTTLKLGCRTYFVPKRLFMFPIKLCEYLNDNRINTLCWVVSALVMISSFGALEKNKPRYLSKICFGSEVFPKLEYNKWRAAYPNASFVNLYGPTEATGMSCYWIANRKLDEKEAIPIGRPFRNTEIILLDELGKRSYCKGEICIRGSCLTLGYFNDREKTDEAFVQNPCNSNYAELVYRTGDIGEYNSHGELVFLGRKDSQIKLMGHRIELGELESIASSAEGVSRACAVYDDNKKKIFLYFTGKISEEKLIEYMRGFLPRQILPSACIRLDGMPLTPNGKIDRLFLKRLIMT